MQVSLNIKYKDTNVKSVNQSSEKMRFRCTNGGVSTNGFGFYMCLLGVKVNERDFSKSLVQTRRSENWKISPRIRLSISSTSFPVSIPLSGVNIDGGRIHIILCLVSQRSFLLRLITIRGNLPVQICRHCNAEVAAPGEGTGWRFSLN